MWFDISQTSELTLNLLLTSLPYDAASWKKSVIIYVQQ